MQAKEQNVEVSQEALEEQTYIQQALVHDRTQRGKECLQLQADPTTLDSSFLAGNYKVTSINALGPPQRLHSPSFRPHPGPPPAAGPPGVSASHPWLH